ncbi:hypothetical protein MLD38_018240 [Melastoma candidum]|uniref:Uncharacterized protein n=1 Tax=Melastoma candidum TaxID=119954 RepID=A0ACB9QT50_9MYRT|nr:hypothetical protein MLD38_018240 [Melastoma candidum]
MAKPTKRRDPLSVRPSSSLAPRNIRRRGRSDDLPAGPLTEPAEAPTHRRLLIIFIVFFVVSPAVSILVYRLRYATSSTSQSSAESHPQRPHYVKIDVDYQGILGEHSRIPGNVSRRNFENPVLAYITPWNSKGYDVAKSFNSKFTHLSPVWYELKSQAGGLALEGRHNVDDGWLLDLRAKGHALILPRVVIETVPKELLTKKKQRAKAVQLIIAECKEMGYDGVVIESWSRWAAYGVLQDPNMRTLALQFVEELGNGLHSVESAIKQNGLQLVYVIGPPSSEKIELHDFGPADLQRLDKVVDGFSLMTYDFSNPRSPGPNAPLKWIQSTLHLLLGGPGNVNRRLARKLWIGLNFYGNDFVLPAGGGAITGANYLSLLQKHRPLLQWEKNSEEHFFLYTDDNNAKHAVFYPSLMSIFLRLEEARGWAAGISIWEIGQGLDYFYDLL